MRFFSVVHDTSITRIHLVSDLVSWQMIFGVMTYLWLIYFISGRLHRFVCLPHQWHSLILSPTPSPSPVPPLPLLATTHVFLCGIYDPASVLFCSVHHVSFGRFSWKRQIWGISFSIISSKVLSKFLQTMRFHSLLVVESHSSVCVCVCVCLHAHVHMCTWIDRYRRRHTGSSIIMFVQMST